jgi:hypothetical protein
MPLWNPKPIWKKRDAFIIGGGPSLSKFNWDSLKGRATIGCNSAYTLGPEICNICIFGDKKWFDKFQKDLSKFKGLVVTNCTSLMDIDIPWLLKIQREPAGLHTNRLGWNGNTGASAINLALILGVKRIFLLGFDMKLGEGNNPNWHDRIIEKPKAEVYSRFIGGFKDVVMDWKAKFSDREIINLTPGTALEAFPKADIASFLG